MTTGSCVRSEERQKQWRWRERHARELVFHCFPQSHGTNTCYPRVQCLTIRSLSAPPTIYYALQHITGANPRGSTLPLNAQSRKSLTWVNRASGLLSIFAKKAAASSFPPSVAMRRYSSRKQPCRVGHTPTEPASGNEACGESSPMLDTIVGLCSVGV